MLKINVSSTTFFLTAIFRGIKRWRRDRQSSLQEPALLKPPVYPALRTMEEMEKVKTCFLDYELPGQGGQSQTKSHTKGSSQVPQYHRTLYCLENVSLQFPARDGVYCVGMQGWLRRLDNWAVS